MSRASKHLPKHVRHAREFLRRIGATLIEIALGSSGYILLWTFRQERMSIRLGLNASERACHLAFQAIRTQFRAKRLLVPEC